MRDIVAPACHQFRASIMLYTNCAYFRTPVGFLPRLAGGTRRRRWGLQEEPKDQPRSGYEGYIARLRHTCSETPSRLGIASSSRPNRGERP